MAYLTHPHTYHLNEQYFYRYQFGFMAETCKYTTILLSSLYYLIVPKWIIDPEVKMEVMFAL